MAFRYSGSKARLLRFLPPPPSKIHIIEPFAGSLSYSLEYAPFAITAAEANPLIAELWHYLRETTPERLRWIETLKPSEKTDAYVWGNKYGLREPEITLTRLTISGAYVGQLSSRVLYPQHNLTFARIIERLSFIKNVNLFLTNDFSLTISRSSLPYTTAFVDPPYLDTSANYKSKKKDHGVIIAAEISDFVRTLKCPVLFTYGEGAPEVFPDFVWTIATRRKVPILRGGGTKERTEYFCTLNWPEQA